MWIPKTGTRQWYDTMNFSDVLKTHVPNTPRSTRSSEAGNVRRSAQATPLRSRSCWDSGGPPEHRASLLRLEEDRPAGCREMPLNQHMHNISVRIKFLLAKAIRSWLPNPDIRIERAHDHHRLYLTSTFKALSLMDLEYRPPLSWFAEVRPTSAGTSSRCCCPWT